MLGNIDSISGAKRKENLTNHAEDARVSKALATAIRDIDLGDIDLDHIAAREPDRSRLRETFREFELRAPLERLEEALGEGEAAAPARACRGGRRTRRRARCRSPSSARSRASCVALATPDAPAPCRRAGAARRRSTWAGRRRAAEVAAYAGGEVLVAEAETLTALAMARGERPVVDPRLEDHGGERRRPRPPALEHDTMVAAYLIDPARRGYPLDELTAEAGHRGRGGGRERRSPSERWSRASLAERQRARLEEDGLTRLLPRGRAAAGGRAGGDGARRHQARRGAPARHLASASASARPSSSGASGSSPARSSRSARRSSSARSCSRSSACRSKRRGKTGFSTDARVLQAIRSRARDHPGDRGVARGHEAEVDLPGRLPRADRRRRPPAHDLQPDRHRHRPPVEHGPEPPEHPDPHRAGARDPRLLRGRGGPAG